MFKSRRELFEIQLIENKRKLNSFKSFKTENKDVESLVNFHIVFLENEMEVIKFEIELEEKNTI